MEPSHNTESSTDSEDSEPGVDQTDRVLRSRSRRALEDSPTGPACRCDCAVPPTAKLASRPRWLPPGFNADQLRNISVGNPVYGFRVQIFCRTGFHLAIFPDKKVRGVDEDRHPCAVVEFSSVDFGEVRIRGLHTNLYLAMNDKGRLYGEANGQDDATVFVEYAIGQYNAYLSRKWAHAGWYVAIKKSGKMKPGLQTRWGQKAMQFLLRRVRT